METVYGRGEVLAERSTLTLEWGYLLESRTLLHVDFERLVIMPDDCMR